MTSRFLLASLAVTLLLNGLALAADELQEGEILEPVTLDIAENIDYSDELSPLTDEMLDETPEEDASNPAKTPPLVLSTTKIGIPADRVGGGVTVITRKQIQQMKPASILDVLRQVPGVDVVRTGGMGNAASIFMRGMNSEHTLVLVDGVEVNDPISPGRTFNYPDQFPVNSVDRIEILRGPHSTLYGSDAMGGVINIITETGRGRPTLNARVRSGSYGTVEGTTEVRGGALNDRIRYNFSGTRQDINGFSAASARYGNRELDSFQNTSLAGRVEIQPLDNLSLDFISRYSDSNTDLDSFGGFLGDDPNYVFRNKTLVLGGRSRLSLFENRFEQISRINYSRFDRRTRNGIDPDHPFDSEKTQFNSDLVEMDIQNNLHLGRWNTLTGGLEMEHETGDSTAEYVSFFGPMNSDFSDRSATTLGFYLQDHIKLWDRWFTTVGLRWDDHNRFGSAFTYRAATSFLIPKTGTTLRASYGTGFKAPTLFQLYAGAFGNPDLEPETSKGWDAGFDQKLFKDSVHLGASYFHNNLLEMIQFTTTPLGLFSYENVGRVRTQGAEVYLNVTPFNWLALRSSYTYTSARDLGQHESLLRRPRHKFGFNVNLKPLKKLEVNVDLMRVSSRDDMDFGKFPAVRTKLDPYTLLNLVVSYHVTKYCSVFGQLVNVMDTPYEDVKGYGVPRLSAYGGIRFGI